MVQQAERAAAKAAAAASASTKDSAPSAPKARSSADRQATLRSARRTLRTGMPTICEGAKSAPLSANLAIPLRSTIPATKNDRVSLKEIEQMEDKINVEKIDEIYQDRLEEYRASRASMKQSWKNIFPNFVQTNNYQ